MTTRVGGFDLATDEEWRRGSLGHRYWVGVCPEHGVLKYEPGRYSQEPLLRRTWIAARFDAIEHDIAAHGLVPARPATPWPELAQLR